MQNYNTKPTDSSFYLYYGFSGLGSNFGRMQPTIRIIGTKLIYTREQNSYYKEKTQEADTILLTTLRTSSIDSIKNILKDLKDTTIFLHNPCIMSGGIHSMTIKIGRSTTNFTLGNTFHRAALKIMDIINSYLPNDKKIRATEQDIIDYENCLSAREKRRKKGKKE